MSSVFYVVITVDRYSVVKRMSRAFKIYEKVGADVKKKSNQGSSENPAKRFSQEQKKD
jgi:hypothetical protein